MRKRLSSILLVLCMVLCTVLILFPVTASAAMDLDAAQIYVGHERISKYNLSGDGWRYDTKTDTLILNDFSLGGTYGSYPMGDLASGIYRRAFIYVGGNGVNLKIRSEGSKPNWLGGYENTGTPYLQLGKHGDYVVYCGIYNPSGSVEISGPAPLYIGTHMYGILTNRLDVQDATLNVYSYANAINGFNFNIRGNSVVNVRAYSSEDACVNTIYDPGSHKTSYDHAYYAVNSSTLTVSDNARLNAEVERDGTPVTIKPVVAIDCAELIVSGGKVSAICRDNGRLGNSEELCNLGISVVWPLKISNGGEVDAYVYNTERKNYSGSAAIGRFTSSLKQIYFEGTGIVRAGVQMSHPVDESVDSFPALYCDEIKYADHMRHTVSDTSYRPDGFEDFDSYQQIRATAADGIFLWDGGKNLKWTYYSDFLTDGGITKPDGTQDSVYLSGKELREVIANGPRLPVTIQSGKFYLNTASDDGNALNPATIEIKKGAELVVFGEGKINDLNVIGEGKITFLGSTVTGKVDKTVAMVVDGGNINVDYEGTATTSGGTPVSRFEYTLTSDETTFEQATYVALLDGRDYGSAGLHPMNGKKLYLWVENKADIRYVGAVQSGVENGFTLYPTSSDACLLEKTEVADISKRSYYVAVPGQNSQIIPFEKGTGHAERYDLSWSFSDDGYTWHGIYHPEAIGANGELNLTDVYSAWSNRMYRCEIRSKEDGKNTLLGVYTALLYIYDPEFRCDGGFVDGKEVTVRFTPTKQPGVSSCRISSIFWEVSEDGEHFKTQKDFSGKDSFTFTVSEEMDGWVLRCSAIAGNSFSAANRVVVEKTYTIHVIEKKVRIEEQPENEKWIDWDSDEDAFVSVKARHATHYQWQVSKRPYVNSVGYGFEDIPGANSSTYSFPMKSVTKENWNYVYRCVVSNEYGEVISDEVYFQTKQNPDIMGFDAKTAVSEGEDAAIDVIINQGNPSVANNTFWEVSTDGGVTYQKLWEVMRGVDEYDNWEVRFSYSGGISFTTSSSLRIYKVTAAMDGWIFRYTLNANGETIQKTATITVHQHEWLEKLTYDEEYHWYSCTLCGAQKDKVAHSYGEGCNPYCTVCGRERAVSHDFRLTASETEHWYQCANCQLESDRQAHAYDNACDGDCNFCKQTRTVAHNYEWQHDAEHHWQLCSKCGDKKNEDAHSFTAENPDSKYLKSAASCTEKAVFYKSCAGCGLSSQGTAHEATFISGDVLGHDFGAWISNGNGTHTRTCARNTEHVETSNCFGGTETCTDKATCDFCGKKYGNLKPHNYATAWSSDGTNHWHKCTACDAKADNAKHTDTDMNHKCDLCEKILSACADTNKDHKCDLCGKTLSEHSGGTATCTDKATCDFCGKKYDDLKPHNYATAWSSDGTNHWHKCTACDAKADNAKHTDTDMNHKCDLCEKVLSACADTNKDHKCDLCGKTLSEHSGGTATCTDKATCDFCGKKYDDLKPHNYATAWSSDGTNHWHKCTACDAKADNAKHTDTDMNHKCDLCKKVLSACADTDKDHKCDLCGKTLSEHSGGTATCTDKATCDFCGKKYDDLNANNHTALKHFDAKEATKDTEGNTEYWYCSDCGKYFADKDGTQGITEADTVIAKLPEKEPPSSSVGSKSNPVLWITLLFTSGGAVTATIVIIIKRKHSR